MPQELPASALEVLKNYRTCELTTLSKEGSPVTWPVCARRLGDGRFLSTTSIAMPQKAFNVRRPQSPWQMIKRARRSARQYIEKRGLEMPVVNFEAIDRLWGRARQFRKS